MPPSPPLPATTRDVRPSPTVSVVIPALNEETNLPLVLEGLPPVDEVVIVDGGSADDTVAVAREVRPDAVVVRQTRTGKGNALICGFAASRGDIVVTLNADGSTDPGEIPRYVDALISGAEVAHGSRYREGGGDHGGHGLDRLGNALLSRFVNALFGTRFTDLGYGYNAYWRSLLPVLDLPGVDVPGLKRGHRLWGDGPEIEPMINIRVAAQGMRVVEVASIGYPPIHGVRQRRMLRRALRALRAAFAEYARRWRIGHRAAGPADSASGAGPRHGTAPDAPRTAGGRAGRDGSAGRRAGRGPTDTGTGSHLRSVGDWRETTGAGQENRHDTGAGQGDWRTTTGTGRDDWRTTTGTGQDNRHDTGAGQGDWRTTTGTGRDDWRTTTGTGRDDWRTTTGSGQWRELAGAARQEMSDGPRYDPAADELHDLDPSDRRSLPMYPEPDSSWTQASGRHAALGDNAGVPRRPPAGQHEQPSGWPPRDEPSPGRGPRRGAAGRRRGQPRQDQPRQDQPRQDQSRPDQSRSDQSRSDQSRSDQSRSDQSRSDQSRSDQSRSERLRPDQPWTDQHRPGRAATDRPGGSRPAPWEGSTSDTGSHHRIEPDSDDGPRGPGGGRGGPSGLDRESRGNRVEGPTLRDVGGGRRRLDSWEGRADGRPDLTVIAGEGLERADRNRPTHLRAVPGERFGR
jgi:hypothetical protein